jgi:hypothetical protein
MKHDWGLYIVLLVMIILFLDGLFYALENSPMLK